MATSKAVARTSQAPRKAPPRGEMVTASIAIDTIPTRQQVADAIRNHSKLYFDGDEAEGSMLPALLENAQRPEDLFSASSLDKLEDHFGEELKILSVDAVRNSDFKDSLGVYLIVTAVSVEGEILHLPVGHSSGLAVLSGLYEMDAFPWVIVFERSEKPTKTGFYPINTTSAQPYEVAGGGTF